MLARRWLGEQSHLRAAQKPLGDRAPGNGTSKRPILATNLVVSRSSALMMEKLATCSFALPPVAASG